MSFFAGNFDDALAQDPEFLLRASLTYNWDVLLPFCDFLMAHHSHSSRARRQLSSRDQWGNTPLHGACYNAAPVTVIQKLLQCSIALANGNGSVEKKFKIRRIRKTRNGDTVALATLDKDSMAQTAASIVDLSGSCSRDRSTPILAACVTGISLEALQMILRPSLAVEFESERDHAFARRHMDASAARSASLPDARGCTPFSELAIAYDLHCQRNRLRSDLPLDQIRPGVGDDAPKFIELWDKWEAMLRAGTSDIIPWTSPVHAAAVLAPALPPIVSSVICKIYPAMVNYDGGQDGKNVLPLHLLISTPLEEDQSNDEKIPLLPIDESGYQIMLHRRTALLQTLLNMDDNLASTLARPICGRSAFCQAIAEGRMTWSLLRDYARVPGPLHCLWSCDRRVIAVRDTVTGLYPFQLAAATASKETFTRKSIELLELDTIYVLLRQHPQLLNE